MNLAPEASSDLSMPRSISWRKIRMRNRRLYQYLPKSSGRDDFPERGIYSASMPDGQLVANPFTHFSRWRAHLDTTTTRPEEVFSLSSRRVGALGRGVQFYECPPHPNLLPTRSSRGEGENFWWLYQDAPLDGDVKRTEVRAPFRFRLGRVADMARYQQICAA